MALSAKSAEIIDGIEVKRFQYFYPYLGLSQQDRLQLDMRAGNLFSFSMLRDLLAGPPPDVYHLHTGKRLGGIVRMAARHHRRPYVISLHGGVSDVPAAERQRWTEPTRKSWEWGRVLGAAVGARRVLDDASAILCVNHAEQESLQRQFPEKRVIWSPNTVNVARYRQGSGARFRSQHGITANARVILNVARIDEQKNQLATLEVFERLASTTPDLWLIFAGPTSNADYAGRLHRAISESRNADRILCLGNIDAASQTLVDMYHASDVFLLNSIHEPFGIVLLEAWAAGLPIVASRVGGIPSFVDNNETGLLFKSGDIECATKHVATLLSDADSAKLLRTRALEKVEAFDTRKANMHTIKVYEEAQREYSLRP